MFSPVSFVICAVDVICLDCPLCALHFLPVLTMFVDYLLLKIVFESSIFVEQCITG